MSVPTLELIALLQEAEVTISALEKRVQEEISPWYAEIVANAAHQMLCVRLEAERVRNLATGEWPEELGDEGDREQGGGVLQTAASATDGGD